MENKKKLLYLVAIVMAAVLSIGLASCSKDDDPEPPTTTGTDQNTYTDQNGLSIIGTWKCVYEEKDYVILIIEPKSVTMLYYDETGRLEQREYFTYLGYGGGQVLTFFHNGIMIGDDVHVIYMPELTATTMVLEGFPDEGTNVFTRQK